MQTESELSCCSQNCAFWIRYLFLASTSFLIVTSERARSSGILFHLMESRGDIVSAPVVWAPTWQITINGTNSMPSKQNPSRWETWRRARATFEYSRKALRHVMIISKTRHVWAAYWLGSDGVNRARGVRQNVQLGVEQVTQYEMAESSWRVTAELVFFPSAFRDLLYYTSFHERYPPACSPDLYRECRVLETATSSFKITFFVVVFIFFSYLSRF